MTDFLINVVFGSSLLLIAAWLVSVSARKKSASLRHAVWASAILSLLFLPFFSLLLPKYSLFKESKESFKERYVSVRDDSTVTNLSPFYPVFSNREELGSTSQTGAPNSSEKITTDSFRKNSATDYRSFVLFAAFCIPAVLRFLQLVYSKRKASQIVSESIQPENPGMEKMLDSLRNALRIHGRVGLVLSLSTKIPFVIGAFKPCIVLPADAEDREPRELEYIFAHELAHIARRDILLCEIARFLSVFYWFQPLLWFAIRKLRIEQEKACDDAVLNIGTDAKNYASTLLEYAHDLNFREPRSTLSAFAFARNGSIAERIQNILSIGPDRKPLGKSKVFILGSIAVLGIILAALLIPYGPPKLSDDEKMAMIAVDVNTPKVRVPLRVLNPDGSPASGIRVNVTSLMLSKSANGSSFAMSYGGGIDNENIVTDSEGRADFAAIPGINLTVHVKDANGYVVLPKVLVSREDMEETVLELSKGIPLHLSMKYSNGKPASGRELHYKLKLVPILGADIENIRSNFNIQNSLKLDENGKLTAILSPGNYSFEPCDTVFTGTRYHEMNLQKNEERLDIVLPDPFFVRILSESDEPVRESGVIHLGVGFRSKINEDEINEKTFIKSGITDMQGYEIFLPGELENYIFVCSPDLRSGAFQELNRDMIGKETEIKLTPNREVKLKLHEKQTGKPLAEREFQVYIAISFHENGNPDHNSYWINLESIRAISIKTDPEGNASVYLPDVPEPDSIGFVLTEKGASYMTEGWSISDLRNEYSFFKPTKEDGKIITLHLDKEVLKK